MSDKAKMTRDHEVIQKWIEEREGWPASVEGTEQGSEEAGLLRVDFPGYSGEQSLKKISWDEFFEKFDESDLVFLYQEEKKGGVESRFCKFISLETAAEKA